MEWTVGLTGLKIRRCHACSIRFATLGTSSVLLKDIERVFKKALAGTLAIVGTILVLAVVLWLTGKQATFSPSESGALRVASTQAA